MLTGQLLNSYLPLSSQTQSSLGAAAFEFYIVIQFCHVLLLLCFLRSFKCEILGDRCSNCTLDKCDILGDRCYMLGDKCGISGDRSYISGTNVIYWETGVIY